MPYIKRKTAQSGLVRPRQPDHDPVPKKAVLPTPPIRKSLGVEKALRRIVENPLGRDTREEEVHWKDEGASGLN
jgi:hypothetical protein